MSEASVESGEVFAQCSAVGVVDRLGQVADFGQHALGFFGPRAVCFSVRQESPALIQVNENPPDLIRLELLIQSAPAERVGVLGEEFLQFASIAGQKGALCQEIAQSVLSPPPP
ncbi:MAG: hypothetical protein IID37_00915 [Planctomycetes bacterium]|nr:hypothetical protein [Planctomycetota bacterium]